MSIVGLLYYVRFYFIQRSLQLFITLFSLRLLFGVERLCGYTDYEKNLLSVECQLSLTHIYLPQNEDREPVIDTFTSSSIVKLSESSQEDSKNETIEELVQRNKRESISESTPSSTEETTENVKELPTDPSTIATTQQPIIKQNPSTHTKPKDDFKVDIMSCIQLTSSDVIGYGHNLLSHRLRALVIPVILLIIEAFFILTNMIGVFTVVGKVSLSSDIVKNVFHIIFWLSIAASLIAQFVNWNSEWSTNASFVPIYPNQWAYLILISLLMCLIYVVEIFFQPLLYYDIQAEKAYLSYEVVQPISYRTNAVYNDLSMPAETISSH